jgi:hypothetical protein
MHSAVGDGPVVFEFFEYILDGVEERLLVGRDALSVPTFAEQNRCCLQLGPLDTFRDECDVGLLGIRESKLFADAFSRGLVSLLVVPSEHRHVVRV